MERRKRILLVTFGTLRDIYPFIAIAHAMRRHGDHETVDVAHCRSRSVSFHCCVQRSDVDFAHRDHRIEGALCLVAIRTCRQVEQTPWRDLP